MIYSELVLITITASSFLTFLGYHLYWFTDNPVARNLYWCLVGILTIFFFLLHIAYLASMRRLLAENIQVRTDLKNALEYIHANSPLLLSHFPEYLAKTKNLNECLNSMPRYEVDQNMAKAHALIRDEIIKKRHK